MDPSAHGSRGGRRSDSVAEVASQSSSSGLWDWRRDREVWSRPDLKMETGAIALRRDELAVIRPQREQIEVLDPETGRTRRIAPYPPGLVVASGLLSQGADRYLKADGVHVRVLRLESESPLAEFAAKRRIERAALSIDGRRVVWIDGEGELDTRRISD